MKEIIALRSNRQTVGEKSIVRADTRFLLAPCTVAITVPFELYVHVYGFQIHVLQKFRVFTLSSLQAGPTPPQDAPQQFSENSDVSF